MRTSEAARGMVEALSGIEAGPALDALAARRLAALSVEEAAVVIADLVACSRDSDAVRKAMSAVCRALVEPSPELPMEHRRAIRGAAAALGLGAVAGLFTEASTEHMLDEDLRRVDPVFASLTLGHRTQIARAETDADRIARLARDDDPAVIRNLLLNRRVTEALVVRIAARRPISGEVLAEVARSRRWNSRRMVRRALALNPCTPPTVVSPMLPLLVDGDLREVAQSEILHVAVRRAARAILEVR